MQYKLALIYMEAYVNKICSYYYEDCSLVEISRKYRLRLDYLSYKCIIDLAL